ncbi:arylamine N-acetyltransferase family protein [Kitasatospora kifunensis]|uniref:N-hydroxyarylamine O-acetyltransferase n=1 Tax=Kitasatospora kifunensis TaxID=58351 RepID=A0A7W7QYB7_KITKI|nr:arylamine N-acetyltransferase [Kitasatospora kifunensis]MBB4922057.1 N-hydroxyarylamine O-acetyltransferase [Kitasatospora kifunensis]
MTVDLQRYCARIGWQGERRATLETLYSLHRAHVCGIPFENLEVLLGSTPPLDLGALQAKLVASARGGYCYEQNTLLAAVLEELGFRVTRLMGRVRAGAGPGEVRPRTHMLLTVGVPGEPHEYLADVGFGAVGALLEPLPLLAGARREEGWRHHRLLVEQQDGPLPNWVLQAWRGGGWEDQYAFTEEPFQAPDYEVANWHVSTHPRSPFRQRLYALRSSADGHLALAGRILTETGPDGTARERAIEGQGAVARVLESEFGIVPPPGYQLPDCQLTG